MINELVTNAAKHGNGPISVRYKITNSVHELFVCDQGEGLPAGFSIEKTTGLGMKVINTLAMQLGGHVTAQANTAGRGACFKVSYPL
jgi:two-component sensor histidine kinase